MIFTAVPSSGKIDPLNYAVIDHCTFVNGLNYRPAFDFGHVEKLQFTNNIVYNPGILGSDFMRRPSKNSGAFLMAVPEDYFSTSSSLVPHRLSEVYYDRSEGITVLACHDPDSMDTQITMRHNNLYMDQVIIDKIATNDTLHVQQWMCSQFSNSIIDGPAGAFFDELLPFVNAPAPAVEVVDVYAGYWDQNPQMSMNQTAPDSADLSYGTAAASYTAAAGGFPLGDLNWYPDKKAEWEIWITDVGENRPEQPADFELSQNYPNPFNPVTVIGYRIARTGDVTLEVFNTMGQKVRTLFNGTRTAGSYQLTWNGKDDSGNQLSGGIYFYRLKAGNETMMKKMIMMK